MEKDRHQRNIERQLGKISQGMLTNADVEAIMNSEQALKGRQAFTSAEADKALTVAEYCAARDLLIMLCLFLQTP